MLSAFPQAMEANYIKSVFFIIALFGSCLAVCETTAKWVITEGEAMHRERTFVIFFLNKEIQV